MRRLKWVILVLVAMSLASCKVGRFLEDDQYVLYRNIYEVTMADSSKVGDEVKAAAANSKQYARQKPNSKVLGIHPIRLKLGIYTLSSPKKDNWWNRWLRKRGQAPVVYDEAAAKVTVGQLEGLMDSKGCFKSKVTFDTVKIKKRDITIKYSIAATPRYHIEQLNSHIETPEVAAIYEQCISESFLKVGDYFDKDNLAKERSRLSEKLLAEGYYRATKDLISFIVDTTDYGNHGLSIITRIANPRDAEGHSMPLQKYYIDQVYIYPHASSDVNADYDTIHFPYKSRNYMTDYLFFVTEKPRVKPKVLSHTVTLFHNQLYRPRNITNTYNSLMSLRNFKFIDIKLTESPMSSDSLRLIDASIRLLPSDRRRISGSLELNNASSLGTSNGSNFFNSGNFGIEGKLAYQNKNLFGGAELLKVEGSILLELPKLVFRNHSAQFHDVFSAFEAGLNISLDVPDFLLPFTRNIVWQRMRPHTIFAVGGSYQYRPYYERVPVNISFGYTWRHSRRAQNQLIPIEMTFVRFFNLDESLIHRLNATSDLRLKYQYSNHFIMDARYDYLYSTQELSSRKNFHYVHLTAETAGNLLHGLSHAVNGPVDENGTREVWGVPYSQYAKVSAEYKYYLYFGKKSTFVTRAMVGVGIPYGNSTALPYEKGFFGGGPTTMRAWQLRHLGPGSYRSSSTVFERMGDLSLTLNVEQRFPIAWIFEGAVFADVGNVWLFNPSEQFPGGEFSFSNFFSSLAAGIGLGLRANISILTIRADFAIPLYDPSYSPEQRWRPAHWRFNQIVTNFGIDYPF